MKLIKLLLFAYILLLNTFLCWTQNQTTIDSLLKVSKSNISDKKKVKNYLKLVYEYKGVDSANVIKYANKALELSTKIDYQEGQVKALSDLAEHIRKHGDYQKAEKLYNQALKTSKLSKYQEGEAIVLNGLGIIFQRQGNYNKALEYHFKALKIEKKINDKPGLSVTYHTIGNLYLIQENNEKALEYYFKSLKIKENMGNKTTKANAYITIGIVYENQKKYKLAYKYYQKALEINIELGNSFGLGTSYNNFGMLYKAQKKYEKAIEYSHKSLSFLKKAGIQAYTAYPILTIAEVYVAQKKWLLAKKYLKEGLEISEKTNNIDNIKIASKWLSTVEKELGNYKKAYEYHVVFKQMSDSLYNDEQTQKIIRLEMDYEFQQEKDSIQFINKTEKVALEKDIKRRNSIQKATYVSLGLLGILFLTLFFFFRSKVKSHRLLTEQSQELILKNEEIVQQAEEIKTLNQVLEKSLDKKSKDLVIKHEKLKEYAYYNAHHTRTPIVNLLGLAQVINTNNVDDDTKLILEKMVETTKQLDKITYKMNHILEEGNLLND